MGILTKKPESVVTIVGDFQKIVDRLETATVANQKVAVEATDKIEVERAKFEATVAGLTETVTTAESEAKKASAIATKIRETFLTA